MHTHSWLRSRAK